MYTEKNSESSTPVKGSAIPLNRGFFFTKGEENVDDYQGRKTNEMAPSIGSFHVGE